MIVLYWEIVLLRTSQETEFFNVPEQMLHSHWQDKAKNNFLRQKLGF